MKWTSFTQLRMGITKTIKKQRSNICNHQPIIIQKGDNLMKTTKIILTTRRRKQKLYDKKQHYIK